MRVLVLVCASLIFSSCFLTSYELHEPEKGDGSVDHMDAGMPDGGSMDAQVVGDAALDASADADADAGADGGLPCALQPGGCGAISCINQVCNCDGPVNAPIDAGSTLTPFTVDCTFTCGVQGSCRTFCREGENCQTLCLDSTNCRSTCLSGSSCDMTCGRNCRSDCAAGAVCHYRCGGDGCTDVRCEQGSQCIMECADPMNCYISCDTTPTKCGDGGVLVCGTSCP